MEKIDKKSLERITGGFSAWVALGIAAAVIFVSGIIEGVVHPKSCNN